MKRIFGLLCAAVLVLCVLPAAFAEPAAGDLNADGKVNGKDITLLQRFVAGGYGVMLVGVADLNGDGKVNAKDVALLQRFFAGGYGAELTPAPAELSEAQKALITYAEAMLARGTRVQYDDTRLIPANAAKEYRWQRQTRQAESYTSQYIGYTNCAAFTHDVYYFGLGFDIGYWATDQLIKASEEEMIFYHQVTGTETAAQQESLKAQFLRLLQPGDIIVRRYTGDVNGHAMFYAGDDRIIHSSAPGGGNYDYTGRVEKVEPAGSIDVLSARQLFSADYDRSFFGGTITKFAIVRPLNVWTGTVPQQSIDRMNNLRGVVVEKLCSRTIGQSVMPDEELRYTIRIENRNDAPVTLEVRDTLDEHVSLVSGCDDARGNELSWTVTVPAGETGAAEYTVRVNSGTALGAKLLADKATVGGVKCECPAVYVGQHLSDAEKAAVAQTAQSVSSELRGWALAGKIYDDALDVDLSAVPTMQEVFAALFAKSSTSGHFYLTNGSPYYAAVAPTMFGGRVVKMAETLFDRVRTRGPLLSQLEIGDVAVCTDNTGDAPADADYTMFMVVGEDSVLRLTGATPALLTGDDAQAALYSLIAYQKFVILRPSALR